MSYHGNFVSQKYLPPAYVVRGKVIFILWNVCLFTIGGGWGYPIQGLGEGYPIPEGYLIPRGGEWGGGYPVPGLGGGTPSQVWVGVTPGYPHHDWMGYPPPP